MAIHAVADSQAEWAVLVFPHGWEDENSSLRLCEGVVRPAPSPSRGAE
jgi:hypothetical protein